MRPSALFKTTLVLAILAAAVACVDSVTPTSPLGGPALSASLLKATKTVASCPLQKEAWKTAQIGSKGGAVSVGSSTLVIPAGALTSTVEITAHAPATANASVEFFPEGLQFALPATLTIPYGKCETPLLGVQIVYVQSDTVTEVETSINVPLAKSVSAEIHHFSSYAVAY